MQSESQSTCKIGRGMLGNIYKKYNGRVKVEKQISHDYYTCKEWLNGKVITTSLTANQINQLKYICTI